MTDVYKCPLCDSILERDRWIKITGLWKERQEVIAASKKQIEKLKAEKLAAEKKQAQLIKKAVEENEKKSNQKLKKVTQEALKAGVLLGVKKEKGERERMSKLIQNQTKLIQSSNKKIKELEKQLKEGKTPQTAGFDYEKEVQRLLTESFPEDTIKPTGKRGDNIQYVNVNGSTVGSILYECKKTARFSSSYISEIKRHQEQEKATYGVIVTHASKDGKSKFFIDNDIVVIDPLGLLDIAFLLRSAIVEMAHLKITQAKMGEIGKRILKYMQSGEFRANMVNTVEKAEEAYSLMINEINDHKKSWQKRFEIYSTIHANVQLVRAQIGQIITGDNTLLENVRKLPVLPEN